MLNEGDLINLLGLNGIIQPEEDQNNDNPCQERPAIIRKNLRMTFDPFTMLKDNHFKMHYRMSKPLAQELIERLQPILQEGTAARIPVKTQVLMALRLFASGSYQTDIGQNYHHPSHQSVVSRSFAAVVDALYSIAPMFIRFPQTPEERQDTQRNFQEFIRIPGILGLIDCVVIKMLKPSRNEEAFFNHKHGHAMNVQVVCNAQYIITDIRICPGSNNDQSIWNHSNVKEHLESLRCDPIIRRNEGYYYFLGDSGYTASPVLLTPMHNAHPNSPEALYTKEHCQTRCRIERLFGKWSNIWRIIKRERALRYAPKKVAKIIIATAVLHNFLRANGNYEEFFGNAHVNFEEDRDRLLINYQQGIIERARIIEMLYT